MFVKHRVALLRPWVWKQGNSKQSEESRGNDESAIVLQHAGMGFRVYG